MRLRLGLTRAEERGRRTDAAEVAAAEDDARHLDAAAAKRTMLHAAMLRVEVRAVVRVVEQREGVPCVTGRARAFAGKGE